MKCARVDDRKRVRIPDAKPGQLFSVEGTPDQGFTLTPVKADKPEPFPRGSLLKYFTPAHNAEELEILKGCVMGPGADEPSE